MKLRDKQLRSQLSNTECSHEQKVLLKSFQAVQLIVDHTGSGYNLFALNSHENYQLLPSVPKFESKGCPQRFLKAMIAEWSEHSLIWSRLSHGVNHVRHVSA